MRRWPAQRTTLANRLRFDSRSVRGEREKIFIASLPIVLTAQLVAFFIVGVYRGTWDHFKRKDRLTFLKGVALGAPIVTAGGAGGVRYYSYSISVFLIYASVLGVLDDRRASIVERVEASSTDLPRLPST